MIEALAVSKAANFFIVQQNLTDRAVEGLFTTLRSHYDVTAHNHLKYIRQRIGSARWSAICFSYQTTPAFLESAANVSDTICGYLMLVEYQGHVAIFTSRIALPSSFKSKHFVPLPIERVEGAIASTDAIFKKMRMRNMSVSQHAMRNKTLEAPNLANVVGPAGSRRYVPQAYTVTANGVFRTATPRTGRITEQSERVGYRELVYFAEEVIDVLLAMPADVSPFIKTFARPMSLAEALAVAQPVTLAMDTNRLLDFISGDEAAYRLIRRGQQQDEELSATDLHQLISDLDQPMIIEGTGRRRVAKLEGNADEVAHVSLNKSSIALRSLLLGFSAQIRVESLGFALGTDPESRTLREFLDDENAFIILFDDVRLAYIDGRVFRDETLLNGGESLLRYLHADTSLRDVRSEKGTFTSTHTAFDVDSCFGAIINHIAATDTVLVCDDLGDEWADFIGIREDSGLTQVSFYHAKHGTLNMSAGSFHISVSQAIKNLGNIALPQERIHAKITKWGETYNAPGHRTQIPRTAHLSGQNLIDIVERARTEPDGIRRAVIVTSSLSKQAVADAFIAIQNGRRPTHTFVQLYWLLQSFFSLYGSWSYRLYCVSALGLKC